MQVVITEWALQSYLNLKGKAVFNDQSEMREMVKLKIKIRKILDGTYTYRGTL